jgi:hypothetical protein
MNPLERAAKLRQEADVVMQEIGLLDVLSRYGKVTFAGSYFLDVMAYPDIDLALSKVSVAQIFEIGGQLAASELVPQVVFERSTDPRLPGGLYLKPRVNYGDWGRPWKIDLWSLDDAIIEKQMRDVRRFKEKMTPHLREQIVTYKVSVLTAQHRTPSYSGYFIYKAFIDEGMTDPAAVTRYLVENGIQMR